MTTALILVPLLSVFSAPYSHSVALRSHSATPTVATMLGGNGNVSARTPPGPTSIGGLLTLTS